MPSPLTKRKKKEEACVRNHYLQLTSHQIKIEDLENNIKIIKREIKCSPLRHA